ncbi:MAG: ABC transporter ATP-binding protein [Cyanobacteria bacterium P01_C01_bin.120]
MNKSDRLLFQLSRDYFHWVLLSILLGFSGALFNGIGMTLVIPIVINFLGLDIISSSNLPPLLETLFSVFDDIPPQHKLTAMMGTIFLTIALKGLTMFLTSFAAASLAKKVSKKLRKECFQLLLDLDLEYFSKTKLGDLMNYINTEVSRVSTSINNIIQVLTSATSILVFLGILVSISWRLTLISTLVLGLLALVNQIFIKYAKAAGKELSKSSAAYSIHLVEVLSGIRLIKSVANEDMEFRETNYLINNREAANFKSTMSFAAVGPVNEVSSVVGIVILVIAGRIIFSSNLEFFSSIILTYLFILTRLLPFFNKLYSARNQLANASSGVENLEYFLNRADKPIMLPGKRNFDELKSDIHFSSLWFQYPQSDQWNLQNIDITLPKGNTLALVGSSGAGKSTMADLLARFYDPTKGEIKIDGTDLKEYDVHQYRKKIGIVSQETFLFNTSVRENIKYGYPSATDEDVFQAAKLANAADFILALPEGFDTQIGDRGVRLSGGQRQRLSIARALLQNPEILILDEATSALDTVSERLVQQALENLSQDRTTLVIAHRLSTIKKADEIAVLDKGEIVEVGDHQTLLQQGGHYAHLHSIQFSDTAEDSAPSDETMSELNLAQNSLSEVSYKIRSQMNGILGVLELLSYGAEDASKEEQEYTSQAYQASLGVLQSLEVLEHKIIAGKQ